jgi:alpha-glucosidase
LGLSGFGLSHSDIGGYTTLNGILTRSEELLLRWAEYSVFTYLMRTHEGKIQGKILIGQLKFSSNCKEFV